MSGEYLTENRDYPMCPYCGEENDRDLIHSIEKEDLMSIDFTNFIRCSSCNERFEVISSVVYSTYKADENDFGDDFDIKDEPETDFDSDNEIDY